MSTEKDGSSLYFTCDDCGVTSDEGDTDSFSEMWAQLKDAGWRCTKEGSDWVHYCPDCVAEWARSQR